MFEPQGSQRDAASAIFTLPAYRVIDVVEDGDGVCRVEVESIDLPGCPVCGALAMRVHARRWQRLRDLPMAGPIEVAWPRSSPILQARLPALLTAILRHARLRGIHPCLLIA